MVYNKFKGFLVENRIKQQEVADLLGISRSRFNQKLNSKTADFTMDEIRLICKHYNLDVHEFFLD